MIRQQCETDGVECSTGEVESAPVACAKAQQRDALQVLKDGFVEGYQELRRRLAVKLGSSGLAEDVLQETYLKLERNVEVTEVRSPRAYLMRMALNLATDRRRAESRLLSTEDIRSVLDVHDELPGPEGAAESLSELQALKSVLAELSERQRTILLASRVHETPHRELARRFGVSTRTIEIELKRALEHCAQRMGRRVVQRFGPGAGRSS